jgi:RNA polymerase sigma-70 factor (family 1)
LNDPTPYNEKALLASVAQGDHAAFRQLFLHWYRQLGGYIFKITESRELAEEIVQDVFMKIWTVRETLTGINNFKHFLLVVSRNRAFDLLKKQLREKKLKSEWEKDIMPELSGAHNELEMSRLSVIEQAIESLPPRRKEVFLLSRGEHLTYQEIATLLDISKESVKTHLKLASNSISGFIRTNLSRIAVLVLLLSNIF